VQRRRVKTARTVLKIGSWFGGIIDHSGNLNSPTPWYAVKDNAMSYFSPAVLTCGPVTLKAGRTLRLRYRLFAHPGRWGAEQLRQAEERFQSE
jgi:hypothetical protein